MESEYCRRTEDEKLFAGRRVDSRLLVPARRVGVVLPALVSAGLAGPLVGASQQLALSEAVEAAVH